MSSLRDLKKRGVDAELTDRKILKALAKAKAGLTFNQLLQYLEPEAYTKLNRTRNRLVRSLLKLRDEGEVLKDEQAEKTIYTALKGKV